MSPSINKALQILAREQALHLGDIAKIRRARDTREETRKRGGGGPRGFAARSRVLARLALLAGYTNTKTSYGQHNRRIKVLLVSDQIN